MQQILEDLKHPDTRRRLRKEFAFALAEDRLEQRRRNLQPKLKNPVLRHAVNRAVRYG